MPVRNNFVYNGVHIVSLTHHNGVCTSLTCLDGLAWLSGNSGWLVCAAVLDCSHLLLIVAKGIVHAMLVTQCKARPTVLCIRLVTVHISVCMYWVGMCVAKCNVIV